MSKRPAKQFMDQARKLREAGEGLSYARTFDFAAALERGESTDTDAPAPAEISPEEAMPQSDVSEATNFSESLRNIATQAAQYKQHEHLDEHFAALGLGSMKGSQISSDFMGRLVKEFKSAKDKGVLDVLGVAERKEKAAKEERDAAKKEKEKERDYTISMIDNLIDRGALSELSGSILRDYEKKAGYPVGYLSAMKEAELELEAAKKAKDDEAVRKYELELEEMKIDIKTKTADLTAAGISVDALGSYFPSVVTGEGNAGVVTQDFAATSPVTSDNRAVLLTDGNVKIGTPGVDIDGRIGDPVYSTISGVVVDHTDLLSNGDNIGLGTKVAIQDPDGNIHFFNHLSTAGVEIGDAIFKGDQIGAIGNSGTVVKGEKGDGSHLDYRTKDVNEKWIDPRQFIEEYTKAEIEEYGKITGTAAVGKMVYGTRISETETPRVERLMEIGTRLEKGRFEIVTDLLGYKIEKNRPLADAFINTLSQYAGEGGLSEFNMLGLSNLINTDDLGGAVNLVEQSIFASKKDTAILGRESATVFAKEFGDNTIDKIEENLGSLGIVAGNWNKLKTKFVENENFSEIESQLTQLVSQWRLEMAGSNITENELKFLDSVIADTKNDPFNAIQKIKSFQDGNLSLLNADRFTYYIPKLNFETLLSKEARAGLYADSIFSKTSMSANNEGIYSSLDRFVSSPSTTGTGFLDNFNLSNESFFSQ